MEAFFASLNQMTLADIVAPRRTLRQRLGLSDAIERGAVAPV
jgi:hypothetical protein